MVLKSLTEKPFEPMASTSLNPLSMKVAFLVAIASARRALELVALRIDPPYLTFHVDKVVLRPDISFLPKVVTAFHINEDIFLPAFFRDPASPLETPLHSLDVRQALTFYKDCTSSFRKSPRLFVCYGIPRQGLLVSPQRLANWITQTI